MYIKNSLKIENAPQPQAETSPVEAEEKVVEKELKAESVAQEKRGHLEIMWEARDGLPKRTQEILLVILLKNRQLTREEQIYFNKTRDKWWKEKFGARFNPKGRKINLLEKRRVVRLAAEKVWGEKKKERMTRLSQALATLDSGEAAEEFNSQERRTVFYSEDNETLYVAGKNGDRKMLGVGDITSDYAWGITYLPDPNMPHSIFRKLAKRILINEARRDIEQLYNQEILSAYRVSSAGLLVDEIKLEALLVEEEQHNTELRGVVAERACREFLTRISLNYTDLNFFVERSNAIEDAELKYDFKLRKKKHLRGIAVADIGMSEEEYTGYKKRIGIQLTILRGGRVGRKKREFELVRPKIKEMSRWQKQPVDDIVFVHIPMPEVLTYYRQWLAEGKPSGGPEQYFSPEIKKELLLKSTGGLIKIEPEMMEKIFPEEKTE